MHHEKPLHTQTYMLLNLAGPEVIEHECSFMYTPAVLGENGTVITPKETREDAAWLKHKFQEICNL